VRESELALAHFFLATFINLFIDFVAKKNDV